MKFLVITHPIDGIQDRLPKPEEFEAQITWIRRQLDSGVFDCAYHGENHAIAIVNAESRASLDKLYTAMPLVEVTLRQVEELEALPEQMSRVLESLREYHAARS